MSHRSTLLQERPKVNVIRSCARMSWYHTSTMTGATMASDHISSTTTYDTTMASHHIGVITCMKNTYMNYTTGTASWTLPITSLSQPKRQESINVGGMLYWYSYYYCSHFYKVCFLASAAVKRSCVLRAGRLDTRTVRLNRSSLSSQNVILYKLTVKITWRRK
jgi:hypothetical protein